MDAQQDFKELLELFNALHVKYMIVGGYALAFHGSPRTTGDIDLFVQPSKANALRVLEALKQFGFGQLGLKVEDFTRPDHVIQLGQPPVRIDIITSLTAVSWQKAFTTKQKGIYGNVPVYFISRTLLVANKKSIGRKKDEADIEFLEEK